MRGVPARTAAIETMKAIRLIAILTKVRCYARGAGESCKEMRRVSTKAGGVARPDRHAPVATTVPYRGPTPAASPRRGDNALLPRHLETTPRTPARGSTCGAAQGG